MDILGERGSIILPPTGDYDYACLGARKSEVPNNPSDYLDL